MTTIGEKIIGRINEDFQVLSRIVMKQINLTAQLIEDNRNEEIHTEINNNERIIDSLDVKMRDEVINVIVLYSPRASTLRKIMAYYDMTTYLERIGDLLLNVSGYLKRSDVHGPLFIEFREDISKMLGTVENMTQNAIFAFTCEDSSLARATIELDDEADAFQRSIIARLQDCYSGKIAKEQDMIDVLSINSMAYNMERIGDNATNIAEAAIYLMEGKNIKHNTSQPYSELQAGSEG